MTEPDAIPSTEFAGEADNFGRLWTPHRMAYIKGESKPSDASDERLCPFCLAPTRSDEDGLILVRGKACYAVLNLYPYNAGHLMVLPYRHVADLTELTSDEAAELVLLTQAGMRTLRAVSAPHGFNIGINQGAVAGAGIAAHLHQHLVPRWGGDTNFMPIVAHTRVLPELLSDTRRLLATQWSK